MEDCEGEWAKKSTFSKGRGQRVVEAGSQAYVVHLAGIKRDTKFGPSDYRSRTASRRCQTTAVYVFMARLTQRRLTSTPERRPRCRHYRSGASCPLRT